MPEIQRRAGVRLSELQLSRAVRHMPVADNAGVAAPISQSVHDENQLDLLEFPPLMSASGSITPDSEASTDDEELVTGNHSCDIGY